MKNTSCPCGSCRPYADCCAPLHKGTAKALTAEALMRSRYSGYVMGEKEYLLATWHPSTRPSSLDLSTTPPWSALEILSTHKGQPGDRTGIVAFKATAPAGLTTVEMHEKSHFVYDNDCWLYLSGEDISPQAHGVLPHQQKTGRNAPCPCGSGKKFKRCCGR